MSADIHTLAGPYALDALPDEERHVFEEHLEACSVCREEVAELQATASRLGLASAEKPPPSLKGRVMGQIGITRQARPPLRVPDRPSGWRRMLVPAAAALALVVLGLGFALAQLNQRVGVVESEQAATRLILTAPDAQVVSLAAPSGVTASFAYSEALEQGVFLAEGLTPLGRTQVYELWLISDDQPSPAGLFRPGDTGTASHLVSADLSRVDALGVTIEPDGGSLHPTSEILISGEL